MQQVKKKERLLALMPTKKQERVIKG